MKHVVAGGMLGLAVLLAAQGVQAQLSGPQAAPPAYQDQRRTDLRSALVRAQGREDAAGNGGQQRQLSPEQRALLREQLRQSHR